MPRIFICYRREDSRYIAGTINDKLSRTFGSESVFFDIDTIPMGVDIHDFIGDAVGQCDVLLAIIGDHWGTATNERGRRLNDPSDSVRIEIEFALKRGIPVIPVLVGEATVPAESELPASLRKLRDRNATEVRAGKDLLHHLERLVDGICKTTETELPSPRQLRAEMSLDDAIEMIVTHIWTQLRRFLLLYWPHSVWGWVTRALLLSFPVASFIVVSKAYSDILKPYVQQSQRNANPQFDPEDYEYILPSGVIGELIEMHPTETYSIVAIWLGCFIILYALCRHHLRDRDR